MNDIITPDPIASANTEPLSALRDIHLPDPVTFWPPALGWWLLVALLLALVIAGWLHVKNRHNKIAVREALAELARLETLYRQKPDAVQLAAEISTLLRRCCLASYPRDQVAGLVGEEWLFFLDNVHGHTHFSQGVGKTLVSAPYQPSESIDADALITLTRSWLKRWSARPTIGPATT